jgi:hypothetical protein
MTTEQENTTTWRDDLAALIARIQEENKLLQKVHNSLLSESSLKDIPDQNHPENDENEVDPEEDQSVKDLNNQQ